jgi:CBS domain-containing protein
VGEHDTTSRTISLDDAAEKTVGEVMIKRPKTLPADALIADVRRAFERPTVRTVLLADGELFVGAIEREGLPDDAADTELARSHVESQPATVTPDMPMSSAVELLERRGEPRLIVLDEDGVTLRGLLCANGTTTGFCVR